MGIVCGLEVNFQPASGNDPERLIIEKGSGITSEGHLINCGQFVATATVRTFSRSLPSFFRTCSF